MSSGSLIWPLIRFIVAFVVVVALAAIASRLVATRARGNGDAPFQMLGGLALGAGRQICAVRVGRRVLILGLGDKQVRLLDTVTEPAEVDALLPRGSDGPGGTTALPFSGFLADALARARAQIGGRRRDR